VSRTIKKGATDQSVYFEVLADNSTTGGRKTGLVYTDITAYYVRNGAAAVPITLATLASASAAWASGGFILVDDTNMPGVYRLDVPDLAFATGAESVVVTIKGGTNMVQASTEIQLKDYNDEADALLDRSDAIETSLTVRGAMRLALAALAGKLSGAGTGTEVFRNVGDTKDRITATISSNNRTAIVTDAT
jgi:hypothetical protein